MGTLPSGQTINYMGEYDITQIFTIGKNFSQQQYQKMEIPYTRILGHWNNFNKLGILVIQIWEKRIESSKLAPTGVEPINNHYYLLQKAMHALRINPITDLQDKKLILKCESDLTKLSTNQLKLWLANSKLSHTKYSQSP